MKFAPFKIENFFRQHEFSAPYGISQSDTEPLTLDELLGYASPERRRQFEKLWLGYTETQGHPELRAAIADMHVGIGADDALEVVPEEGVFLPMSRLLAAGDHVVAMQPSFQSLWEIARATGCELSFWQQRRTDAGWHFDVDELEALIRPDTKMLIINFPHNPTGYLPSQADFQRIVELARRQNMILFSDEIYRFTEHDESLRLPSACELYERAIVLGGLSKCFGLPGLRVGWLITRDADLLHKLQEMKSYTTICGSAPSEILALIALENWRALTARSSEIVRGNIGYCRDFFGRYSELFWLSYPKCGTITLAELTADMPVAEFANAAVAEQGLMVLPADVMLFEGNYFRLGLGRTTLPHALEPFEQFINDHFLSKSKKTIGMTAG
ncbi:MAG: aminotransferase class I/II-fold pyridoxal phosphate-dependent enzyme [Chloroflexi bacterium]|nr:aminotransferase class I/II-fold pyridoxal phosphate-dependent enzyme [Chloroflexota bacterium]